MADIQPTHTQPGIWKPITGFEGLYEVSDRGKVRSLDRVVRRKDGRTCTYPGKLLKPYDNQKPPYFSVNLWKDGKLHRAYIHRLVLETFVGPCPPGMETCHGPGGSYDNRLENLRWDTPHENSLDTVRHGNNLNSNKTHCKYGHEFTEENTMYSKDRRNRWCKICNRQRARDWHLQKKLGLK